jgi:hypothetical protein
MHVPSNRRDPQRQRWRGSAVAMSILAILALGGAARAVEFDEKLKAPLVRSQAEMQSQAQPLAARYQAMSESEPMSLITDAAFARQRFDLTWQVRRAIDERKPLDALASQGLESRGDGSYRIDLGKYPQWAEWHNTMAAMLSRANFDATAPALIARGFRPQDVTVLKEYAASFNPQSMSAAETLPIAIGFGRAVRKYDKLKRPVPPAVVTTFLYQRELAASESDRRWVEGLLKRLDDQRARILMGTFLETSPVTTWSPSNLEVEIEGLLAQVRHPDFEAMVTAETKGVAP